MYKIIKRSQFEQISERNTEGYEERLILETTRTDYFYQLLHFLEMIDLEKGIDEKGYEYEILFEEN